MAWYDEAVFYHIYPLGLLGAEKQNPYGEVQHRLKELDPWISHIKEIGCNAIYIGPLFESVGHGYETTDYYKLDSRLGDNNDLKAFVAECHRQGLRVIFDGVFNHTGRDFFAFQDIKNNRENSPYRDWYCNVNFWGNNEYNDGFSYENWGGFNLLVKLNQRNPQVRDYICNVIRFWVSEFDVDGIRLDAADVLDFDFMKALRGVADTVKPEFWLMGEVIHGDYSRWVNEGTLHSVTNYQLHKGLFSGHNDHNYFEIAHTVRRLYDMAGGLKLYDFVDNHDVERIHTKLSEKAHFFPVHVLLYTLPGIPSIYYGSEFGIDGHKYRGGSDDEIRPALNLSDFGDAVKENSCTRLIAALGRIHQNTPALSYGDYRELSLTTRQYAFARSLNGMSVIVTVNNDGNECMIHSNGLPDGEYVGALSGEHTWVNGGAFTARVFGNSGEIWIPAGYSEGQAAFDFREMAKKAREEAERKEAAKREAERKAQERREEIARKQEEARKAGKKADLSGLCAESAMDVYNLGAEYAAIDCESIRSRSDYENMSVEELQVAILEKMRKNGPVNDQMKRSVTDNRHQGSLMNWVRSFR